MTAAVNNAIFKFFVSYSLFKGEGPPTSLISLIEPKMATSLPIFSFGFLSLYYLSISLLTLIVVLLAQDIITLPFLTPIAHRLTTTLGPIVSPVTPFISPLWPLGIIHILRSPKCKVSTTTKLAMAGIVGQYVPTLSVAIKSAWGFWKKEMEFGEAWKGLVECLLLVVLTAAEMLGWKWDAGLLDGFPDEYSEEWEEAFDRREERAKNNEQDAVLGLLQT
jgi:hypothetical protein